MRQKIQIAYKGRIDLVAEKWALNTYCRELVEEKQERECNKERLK